MVPDSTDKIAKAGGVARASERERERERERARAREREREGEGEGEGERPATASTASWCRSGSSSMPCSLRVTIALV